MAQFRIRIPDAKLANAVAKFVAVYPNNTADPAHEDHVPHPTDPTDPGGITDVQWLQKRTRQWLRDTINVGGERQHEAKRPLPDDDVVGED